MYYAQYYSILEEVNKEYYDAKLQLESVHPIDIITNKDQVLTEAIFNKDKINMVINKIIVGIVNATNKFVKISSELISKNNKQIQEYRNLPIDKLNFDDFEYSIYPYWIGLNNMLNIKLPSFNQNNISEIVNNGGMQFKINNYPKGLFDENNNYALNADFLRGGSKEIEVNRNNAKDVYNKCIDILMKRDAITNKLKAENFTLSKLLQTVVNSNKQVNTVTESTLLDMSIFKEEYIDILYEDAMVTTKDIKNEDKPKTGTIDTNKEQNDANKETSNQIDATKAYVDICYPVNAKSMQILDTMYDAACKYCAKVANLK